MTIRVDQLLIGDYRNFVYLLTAKGKNGYDSMVVDPQDELGPWETLLSELNSQLIGVLLTHTHWDHIAGVPKVVKKYGPLPIYVHRLDAHRMSASGESIQKMFSLIEDEMYLSLGDAKIKVLHTPGHSAGECSFLIRDKYSSDHLLTGDTIFVGDVGRTDLETGSNEEMFATIARLKKLSPHTIIYPGHDYGKTKTSTISQECIHSAAFRCKSVEELDALP